MKTTRTQQCNSSLNIHLQQPKNPLFAQRWSTNLALPDFTPAETKTSYLWIKSFIALLIFLLLF